MNKLFYPSPLTEDTSDIACGHNAFTHHVFPWLVSGNGVTAIEELQDSPASATSFLEWALSKTNETLPMMTEQASLHLRDISVTCELLDDSAVVILTLTKPREPIGVYFIGLLAAKPETGSANESIRYFTLERAASRGSALCEWATSPQGNITHRYLTAVPKATTEHFLQALAQVLDSERLTRGN